MADDGSAGSQLSNAAIFIKIGSRDWKIGEKIYSVGTTAVSNQKMRENFRDCCATARVEGVIVGKGATKKVCVRWTNLKVSEEMEYGYNHQIFKDPSAQSKKKVQKNCRSIADSSVGRKMRYCRIF